MGFYGNITNTANTTFSFDIVYSTRLALDANCDTDGVFLGRYVLVDYDDQEVIKAYFIEGQFYNKPKPNLEGDKADIPLTPRLGVIYQALNVTSDTGDLMFYKWNKDTKKYQVITATDGVETPYVSNFRADVETYGRGYDSTVWVKHYDPTTNRYKYVMVAELNAAVPTFHLVTDPPTPLPTTPYIDRDTTNLDYYLHQQGNYGFRVNAVKNVDEKEDPKDALYNEDDVGYSDEKITRNTIEYTVNNSGYQDFKTKSENVWLDIFYNNKGFQEDIHTNITDLKNEIGYSFSSSGRKYGNLPLPNSAITADDTVDWHIRLPGIGNAICRMWDRFYGNRAKDNKRYLNFAQKRKDSGTSLVTYDQDTVIGIINTARDMLGYYYIPLSELVGIQEGDHIGPEAIETTVTHTIVHNKGNIKNTTIKYPILQCLYYDDNNYYHYAYTPTYEEYDNTLELKDGVTYYYKTDEGTYRVANPEARKYNNADHVEQTLQFWKKIDGWTLKKIIPDDTFENSIYGLITEIHKLLGTNVGDTRDYGSIQGSINIIKDIVESLELKPDRLVCTNEKGQLTTHDSTYFPSATWDRDEVLNGNGDWVSRFATVKVLKNSTNAHQKAPKVNNAKSGTEAGEGIVTITSDNNKDDTGARPSNEKELHSPNNLTLGTRNKWIQLHADNKDDSIEFRHLESPIIGRLRAEQATGSSYIDMYNGVDGNNNVVLQDSTQFGNFSTNENATEIKVEPTTDNLTYKSNKNDQNDNRLTIPYLTVDNAGHVVELGTKNFNIPHGFKKVHTDIVNDDNENPSSDTEGTSIAESIIDTLELAPQNRWIDIATTTNNTGEGSADDKITFGHRLASELTMQSLNSAENGEYTILDDKAVIETEKNKKRLSNPEIVPTIYRFGLPQNKNITKLDSKNNHEAANTFNVPYIEVDKAGHVVAGATHTVTLPENFTTITVLESSTDTNNSDADQINTETSLKADTLQDILKISTKNRWVGIGIDPSDDSLTFGHKLVPSLNDTITLNGDPRITKDGHGYEKVHRYGLPQDKFIADLDEQNGNELANTFNVPYIEVDNAGHIVAAETHTVTVPHGYSKISTGDPINDAAAEGKAGHTIDTLAKKISVSAETLEEEVIYAPSNKWIRINASNDEGQDTVTFGHEIHTIVDTQPDEQNLDSSTPEDKTFTTQIVNWDQAGHIIDYGTKTWTLPRSIRNIKVDGISTGTGNPTGTENVTIEADYTSDTVNMNSANKWIRLTAKNNSLTFGHLTQGTAGSYTGIDDVSFAPSGTTTPRFGESVTLYGYTTDEAGHVIDYPTYTLTLPKGSYESQIFDPKENEYAKSSITDAIHDKVITKIGFTSASGKIISYSQTLGSLLLTDYEKNNYNTSTIEPNDSLNTAISKLEAQVANLKIYGTIKIGDTNLTPSDNASTLSIVGSKGITISPDANNNSFTISHNKTYSQYTSGFYKFSTDTYGHVSKATEVTINDLTQLGAATADNLTAHIETTTGNPHGVTAEDVGLKNVTNESKTTMFKNPSFTGSATVDGKSIATTDYIQSILSAFNITLKDFTVNVSPTSGVINTTLTATIDDDNNTEASYAYQWYKQNTGSTSWTKISSTSTTYKPTAAGSYRCTVTKTCCGIKKAVNSATVTITAS